jgi:hypothetical protein
VLVWMASSRSWCSLVTCRTHIDKCHGLHCHLLHARFSPNHCLGAGAWLAAAGWQLLRLVESFLPPLMSC